MSDEPVNPPSEKNSDCQLLLQVKEAYKLNSWAKVAGLLGIQKGHVSEVLSGKRELSLLSRLRAHDILGAEWAATALKKLGLTSLYDGFIRIAQNRASDGDQEN
jgi:transcriptional regulator with XRE-family HTH domain